MVTTSPVIETRAAGGSSRAVPAGATVSAASTRRRVGSTVAFVGLVLMLGACSFNLSVGGSSTIDPGRVESKIEQFLPGTSKLKVTSVKCPDGIKEKKGHNFTCSAVLGGNKFTIRVTQLDSSGNVHLERVEAIVDPTKAAQLLESNGYTGASCGTGLLVITPGKTFSCTVTDANGQAGTIPIKVTSRAGDVTVGTFVPTT